MTDQQALREYAAGRNAGAFRILVEQYQRLVYSAASRRLAHAHDVEDVVQLTFLKLARSAGGIHRDLSAWLYTTTINTANDLIRRDQTRRRHETLAAASEAFVHDSEREEWQRLSLLIDEVVLELPRDQQALIVEHFLRGRSQRDLAGELDVSQPTVLRRINGAVDELRKRLSERGCTVAAPVLAAGLGNMPDPTIPATVTAELAKVGLSGLSAGPAGPASVLTGSLMFKIGMAAVLLAAVAGGVIFMLPPAAPPGPAAAAAPATEPALPAANPADWRAAFNAAYALRPGQNLKFIPPPPLAERQRYLLEVERNDSPMPFIQWRWTGSRLKREFMAGSGPNGAPLWLVLEDCAKIDQHHASIEGFLDLNFDGDWIVRDGATTEAILGDLRGILHEQFKTDVQFAKSDVTKEALVVSGAYRFKRIAGATDNQLQVFSDVLDHPQPGDSIAGGGTTEPAFLWTTLGDNYVGIPIVDEARNEPANISWLFSHSIASGDTEAGRQQILDNITKQTGLTFKKEERTFTTWKFTSAANANAPSTKP